MTAPNGAPPSGPPRLQLKMPCATLDEVRARHPELASSQLFVRTSKPKPAGTSLRIEVVLTSGATCLRGMAVVIKAVQPPAEGAPAPGGPPPGMLLSLGEVDEAGRQLLAAASQVPAAQTPGGTNAPTAAAAPPAPAAPVAAQAPVAPVAAPAPAAAAAAPQAKPTPKGPVIGIDLGTSNSCAAVVRAGKAFVIPSREGYNTIPSIIALNDKGKLIVGHPAKGQLLINPANTVYGAKRLVGRQFASPVVRDLCERFPYKIVGGQSGEAAVALGDKVYSMQQVSALVLGEVREIAQQYLHQSVERAVITVPAYYNDNQRNAVREAGALAGLHVERILNEPTAAALAFANGRTLEQRLLVYDLGGGTFDASVLELHGNVYEVISTGGDTFLGGVDFDRVLVDHLLTIFKKQHGIDFPGDRVALQRVTDAAERAKMALSEQMEHQVRVPFIALVDDKPYDLEAKITRAQLVQLTNHLVDKSLEVCKEVLANCKLTPADIDEVLLVGGQSRMPLVRQRIQDFFAKPPSKAVHPDEAVALGAALLADSLESGRVDGMVLIDVLPMSIGIGLPGGRYKKLIERNTTLPHRRDHIVTNTKDNQETLELTVFQGESDQVADDEFLGVLRIPGIRKGPKGTVSFRIEFAVSAESILSVTAEDQGTGKKVTAQFNTRDTADAVNHRTGKQARAPRGAASAEAEPQGGLVGWLRKVFGGGQEPRA